MPLATTNSPHNIAPEGQVSNPRVEILNPKSEGRRPKEIRSPKSELRKLLREAMPIRPSASRLTVPASQRIGVISGFGLRISDLKALFVVFLLIAPGLSTGGEANDSAIETKQAFQKARQDYQSQPQDDQAAWHFARAAFDWGDLATNDTERAEIAQQGITACERALTKNPDSVALHYYLGLNEGQLARTRSLGALKLVDLMEKEFTRAIELEPKFDYGGPERSLGLLYRDAPSLVSIGNRTKARLHLQRAVELAPQYPENRLNLVESELKWGDRKGGRRELKALEDTWADARSEFSGSAWKASWLDWEARLQKIKKTLEEPARLDAPRH
jgi:tetratricopeptide (TPR) repeat protein